MSDADEPTRRTSGVGSSTGQANTGLIGQQIGRYQIIDVIGQGGMGTVYEAVQENPRRRVALKVINAGVAQSEVMQRFEHEAQFLGRLHHPGIAEIYESGTFDLGFGQQPYFAMELVEGETLLNHARHRGLDVRERLALVVRACHAMLHAHQMGVIHRDLKPANIVVVDEGQATGGSPGQPKILDFGVARAVEGDAGFSKARTEVGSLIGTISYMSPEQAIGDPDALDTRSDVYALGVIAYELISGHLPFDLDRVGVPEALRRICKEEIPPLATISPGLDRDLSIIIAKALEKDKDQRYQSMLEFAQDIERYLRNEAILAHPPSLTYRLLKFTRRNKLLVSGVALLFFVVITGAVVSTMLYLEADAARSEAALERDRAERHARDLEQVAAFQAAQLADVDVARMGADLRGWLINRADHVGVGHEAAEEVLETILLGADFTGLALQLLETHVVKRAMDAIEMQFDDQPLVQASLYQSVSDTLRTLGRFEEAEVPQQRALELRRERLADEHPDTLQSIHGLGRLLLGMGRYEEAKTHLQQALELRQRLLDDQHPDTLQSHHAMGLWSYRTGDWELAREHLHRALAGHMDIYGEMHRDTLDTLNLLGLLYQDMGDFGEAESYYRRALMGRRQVLGEDHPDTLASLNNMGYLLSTRGEFERAESYYLEALDTRRRVLGDEHPGTLRQFNNLGFVAQGLGRIEEAESHYRRALAGRQQTLGPTHPDTLVSLSTLGDLLAAQGQFEAAEALMRQALDSSQEVLGEAHPRTIASRHNLGQLLGRMGRLEEGERLSRGAVDAARYYLGDDHWFTGAFLAGHARTLAAMERFRLAAAAAIEAREIMAASMGPTHDRTREVTEIVVEIFELWERAEPEFGRAAEAEQWRDRLSEFPE